METKLGFSIEILGAQDAVTAAEQLRRKIAEIQSELKKATDTKDIARLGKELVDLKAKQAEVNKEVKEQVKTRQEELTGASKAGTTYRELSKRLGDLRRIYKDMAAAEQDATQEAKDLLSEITKLDARLKKIDGDVGQFNRNVGNYTGALAQFFPKVGSSIGGVTDALGFLKGQTTAAGKGFGTLAVGFAAFGAVSDLLEGLNEQIKETRALQLSIANLTGQTGDALQKGAAQSKAIAEAYGQSAEEIAIAANTFSKELGINFTEALDLVEVGFRKGANAQGEFLDNLREYPAQFRDAGASAQDFLAISIAASREGVYSDKGLDAVKEFGLRIREQTKATKTALSDALGEQFTSELFGNLNKGSITSVQALGKVTTALKENGVQGSQLQTVIADVFGGPGEDVGQRFLFTLGDIVAAQNDLTVSTNEYQEQQNEVYKANLALEESQALYNEAFADYSFELEIAEKKGRAFLNNVVTGFFKFLNQAPALLKTLGAGLKTLFTTGSFTEAGIQAGKVYADQIKKIAEEDKKQRAFLEAERKKEEERNAKERAERLAALNRKTGSSAQKAFVEGSVAALQAEKSNLERALENTVGEAAQRKIVASIAVIEARLKEQIDNINRLRTESERQPVTEFSAIGTRNLLDTQIEQTKKTEDAKTKAVFDAVKKREAARKKEIDADIKGEQERREKALEQVGAYTDAAFQLYSAFAGRKQELENRKFDEQISATEANIQQLESKAQQASGIRARILQKQIQQQQEVLKRQQEEADVARRKRAKQEKTLSIIQSIIFGALGVSRALAEGGLFGAIAAGVLAAAQTATIVAQPLATGGIVGISGRRVNDRQNMTSRANGDNVLATVRRGEVVLNERQQSALGGAHTFKAIGVPGFAGGGAIGAPKVPGGSGVLASQSGELMSILAKLDAKTDAINGRIDRLKAYVVSEEVQRDLNEGNALKIQATL